MRIPHNGRQRERSLSEHKQNILRLFMFWPEELADDTLKGHQLRVERMELAIDQLRKLGLKGHWSYSIAVHEDMIAILKIEKVLMRRSQLRIVKP